jgi:lipoprotein NlpI
VLYETQGLWEKAKERYRLALLLNPKLNFTHFNLGRIYLTQGKLNLATEEIIASFASDAGLKDKKKTAFNLIQTYLKTIKKPSSAAIFYNNLGVYFARKELKEAALSAFQLAIQLEPAYADSHFNLGLTFWKNGLKKEAISELKTVLKIKPNHHRAKVLLNQIIYQKGRK